MQISENTRHLLDRDGSFNYIKREDLPAALGTMETYWLIGRNSVARSCADHAEITDNPSLNYNYSNSLIHHRNSLIHHSKERTRTVLDHNNQGLLIHEPLRSLTMSRSGICPKSESSKGSRPWENEILGSMEESESEEEEDFGYDVKIFSAQLNSLSLWP